jgi:flagellar protein FliT
MTSIEILSTYQTLSELTDTMLSAARQDEWDRLAALEQRCQSYVENLAQAAPVKMNPNEQSTKVAIIRTILQNDAKIRALAEPHMHELQQRLYSTRTNQRSIQAYGERPA